jgi:hypothetical protein
MGANEKSGQNGTHIAHDPKDNPSLSNLFVRLAQRMGVDVDSFGASNATGITGLELL